MFALMCFLVQDLDEVRIGMLKHLAEFLRLLQVVNIFPRKNCTFGAVFDLINFIIKHHLIYQKKIQIIGYFVSLLCFFGKYN